MTWTRALNLVTLALALTFLGFTLWWHFGPGSPYWPRRGADGHYECMKASERYDYCFWLGERRDDGAYNIKRSRQ